MADFQVGFNQARFQLMGMVDNPEIDELAFAQAHSIYEQILSALKTVPQHATPAQAYELIRDQVQTVCMAQLYAYLYMAHGMQPSDWPSPTFNEQYREDIEMAYRGDTSNLQL